MPKFYGIIGFSQTIETSPGVWSEEITEKYYYGEIIKDTRSRVAGESINDNFVINNKISILSDLYAYQTFPAMRYVQWMGSLWKITNVELQRPRLILTIGGLYTNE